MSDPTGTNGANPDPNGTTGSGDPVAEPKDPAALLAKNQELLGLLRKEKDKAAALEKAQKDRDEEALRAKEDWKKIAETREAELKAERDKLSVLETERREQRKLAAFLEAVGGQVEKKYWGLIDLDRIPVNPDTSEVDKTALTKYVDTFKKEHSILIAPRRGTGQPTDAPAGTKSLSHAEWLALPAKEMAKRLKDVRMNEK